MLKHVVLHAWLYKPQSNTTKHQSFFKSKIEKLHTSTTVPNHRAVWAELKGSYLSICMDPALKATENETYDLLHATSFERVDKSKLQFVNLLIIQTISGQNTTICFKFDDYQQRNDWFFLIDILRQNETQIEDVTIHKM